MVGTRIKNYLKIKKFSQNFSNKIIIKIINYMELYLNYPFFFDIIIFNKLKNLFSIKLFN